MSKMLETKMASLSDKIYDGEVEQDKKRELKPRKKLISKKRGSSRTSRTKKGK